ncbi:hypothetical protein J3E72DRAFT_309166 [Bipolaris maydis]|uniref:uncharacterized protein n=1 Tax=Cochliobolus heterostrophus TaxID=5016 RepID=UPI0024DB8569|nr:hypothetical protein J3E73DRAFT_295293 [Bipolaris maydis]KAJ5046880.1 hypothetical protein J3E74DRAFT_392124 [Bipolaris maydis]KAJ5062494.1 hypothetical protein J3E74DRAFT_322366 [Bipolaris maydis]KAJ6198769.1 hypothetical protein J3E72DRAFT_309166 [Bipolaris maydis]KAJ6204669.1 hypothetical protein PSV09DRAFT_2346045 [Bipolaris maydis]
MTVAFLSSMQGGWNVALNLLATCQSCYARARTTVIPDRPCCQYNTTLLQRCVPPTFPIIPSVTSCRLAVVTARCETGRLGGTEIICAG